MKHAHLARAIIIASMLTLAGCAMNPVSGTPDMVFMTETQEVESGAQFDVKIRQHFGAYDNKDLQTYVDSVGQRLAKVSHRPELKWRFTVLDSATVNAFALPGGYVYITRGLMSYLSSEADLAAVLGHEIGHVTARHGVRQHSKSLLTQVTMGTVVKGSPILDNFLGRSVMLSGAGAFLASYSRDFELDADSLGAEYLSKSSYDPKAILNVLTVLKDQEVVERDRATAEGREPRVYHGVFASHPSSDDRLQEIIEGARGKNALTKTGEQEKDRYLDMINGMVFGDGEDEGVLRGQAFYHRDLNFMMKFPNEWRIENSKLALLAFSKDQKAMLIFTGKSLTESESPKERLREEIKSKDMRQQKYFTVPGGEGYSAVTRAKTPWGYADIRVAVVVMGKKAYIFRGFTKEGTDREPYDETFIATAASIRKLSVADMRNAEPLRLRLRTVLAGDDYEQLAKKSPIASYPAQVLRLINGHYPKGQPKTGQRIKVVE